MVKKWGSPKWGKLVKSEVGKVGKDRKSAKQKKSVSIESMPPGGFLSRDDCLVQKTLYE